MKREEPVAVAGWLSRLTNMGEDSRSNPASYLCWNTHVGKRLVTMLVTKRLAGVALKVNLGERISHTPLPSMNMAAHSDFETQSRCHQKSKTGLLVAPQKRLLSSKNFLKKRHEKGVCTLSYSDNCAIHSLKVSSWKRGGHHQNEIQII